VQDEWEYVTMAEAENVIWGIHGGRMGDADDLFLRRHHIAIGWEKIGDLSTLKASRDAFKAKVAEVFPDAKAGAIPNW
jgi:restriction system protein